MRVDLTGQKFGELTVISEDSVRKDGRYWLCRCSCGKETVVRTGNLTGGYVRSCGHLASGPITHGGSHTRLYHIWYGIIRRTEDPKRKEYKNYGARGIRMCKEWRNNFAAFRDWALANGYTDELSIDRIDNDGDYKPENCRWADKVWQENNKRDTLRFEVNGIVKTCAEWAREYDLPYPVVRDRLYRGWDGERIISTAVGG